MLKYDNAYTQRVVTSVPFVEAPATGIKINF